MTNPKQQDESTYRLHIAKDYKGLFVRLSRDVLTKLVAGASQERFGLDPSRTLCGHDDPSTTWHFAPGETDTTTFLPLEIMLGESTIYASFNGGILNELQGEIQTIVGFRGPRCCPFDL